MGGEAIVDTFFALMENFVLDDLALSHIEYPEKKRIVYVIAFLNNNCNSYFPEITSAGAQATVELGEKSIQHKIKGTLKCAHCSVKLGSCWSLLANRCFS